MFIGCRRLQPFVDFLDCVRNACLHFGALFAFVFFFFYSFNFAFSCLFLFILYCIYVLSSFLFFFLWHSIKFVRVKWIAECMQISSEYVGLNVLKNARVRDRVVHNRFGINIYDFNWILHSGERMHAVASNMDDMMLLIIYDDNGWWWRRRRRRWWLNEICKWLNQIKVLCILIKILRFNFNNIILRRMANGVDKEPWRSRSFIGPHTAKYP